MKRFEKYEILKIKRPEKTARKCFLPEKVLKFGIFVKSNEREREQFNAFTEKDPSGDLETERTLNHLLRLFPVGDPFSSPKIYLPDW